MDDFPPYSTNQNDTYSRDHKKISGSQSQFGSAGTTSKWGSFQSKPMAHRFGGKPHNDALDRINMLIKAKEKQILRKKEEYLKLEKIWKNLVAADEAVSEFTKMGVIRSITQDVVIAAYQGDIDVIIKYLDNGQFDAKVLEHLKKTYEWMSHGDQRTKKPVSVEELGGSIDKLIIRAVKHGMTLEDASILKNKLMVVALTHPYVRMATTVAKGATFASKLSAQYQMQSAKKEWDVLKKECDNLYAKRANILNPESKGFEFGGGHFGGGGAVGDW